MKKVYVYIFSLMSLGIIVYFAIWRFQKSEQDNKFKLAYELYRESDSLDLPLFQELSDDGHQFASFILGYHYFQKKDFPEAIYRFVLSREDNELDILTSYFIERSKGVTIDEAWQSQNLNSVELLSIGKAGDWYLKFIIGSVLIGHSKHENQLIDEDAFKLILESAELGYPSAMYRTAICFSQGLGVNSNLAEALKWLTRAAEHNELNAQVQLGENLVLGTWNCEKSIKLGLKYTQDAARKNNARAQYNLANWYFGGSYDVSFEPNAALKWARASSENGNSDADNLTNRIIEWLYNDSIQRRNEWHFIDSIQRIAYHQNEYYDEMQTDNIIHQNEIGKAEDPMSRALGFFSMLNNASEVHSHNAWQCVYCGVISRGSEKPSGGDFGGSRGCAISHSKNHYWKSVNTNGGGWQCNRCGSTCYTEEEPSGGEFGGGRGCVRGYSHHWRRF